MKGDRLMGKLRKSLWGRVKSLQAKPGCIGPRCPASLRARRMPETAAIVKNLDKKQNQYIFSKYTNKIYEC
jgi:hypothetical protein